MPDIRILVVEDEAIVAKDLQHRLIRMGYDVPAVAHTGRDAVRLADELCPDLILMDIRLRGSMDGVMAAEAIADKADIPVIFLTAYSDDNTVQRAKAASPMAYLVKPFEDRDLNIAIEMAFFRNYTSQVIAASERKYRSIFENANDVIVHLNSAGLILDVNRKSQDLLGYSREELVGKNLSELEFVPDKLKAEVVNNVSKAIEDSIQGPISMEFIHRDGHTVFLDANYSLIESHDGGQDLLAIVRDVTRRVKMARELQDRNEQLDSQNEELRTREEELECNNAELAKARAYSDGLLQSLTDGFVVIDFEGKVLDVNDTCLEIFGLTREEIIGRMELFKEIFSQDAEMLSRRLEAVVAGGRVDPGDIEVPYKKPDGTVITLSFIHNIVKDTGGNPSLLFVVARDITERKRAEEALRASEERFRDMAEMLPICLTEFDLEGKVTFANRYAEDLYGYPWRDIDRGLNVLAAVAPEDHPRAVRNMSAVFKGERLEGNEYTGLKADGTTFPMVVYSSPIEKEGKFIGMRTVTVDLTDRKRAEEESSRANALEELNRLKTILLATVSHELRTPLTSIKGLASTLIQPDVNWDAQTQKEFLHEIDKAADRLTHIVGDLIDMSQIEAGMMRLEKSPTTMSILLEQLDRQLRAIASKHKFKMDIPANMPIIYCDEVRIGQVITNLVSNAAAYSPPGTTITVEAIFDNGRVEVSVTDEGIGIPQNKLESVFDRFHRLEEGVAVRRGGTGLGLAICKGIMAGHGGRITVESREREGSRFSISLPIPADEEVFSGREDLWKKSEAS